MTNVKFICFHITKWTIVDCQFCNYWFKIKGNRITENILMFLKKWLVQLFWKLVYVSFHFDVIFVMTFFWLRGNMVRNMRSCLLLLNRFKRIFKDNENLIYNVWINFRIEHSCDVYNLINECLIICLINLNIANIKFSTLRCLIFRLP